MKKKTVLIPVFTVIILGIIALSVYLTSKNFDTTLEFQARDSVSENWIWDSTIKLQDRKIRSFYQSDRGPVYYQFNNLKTGDWDLEISAPAYQTVIIPVSIKKGKNRIEKPIELNGYEIPSLDHFLFFEQKESGDILVEMRPVGTDGRAVMNHPCIDLWIGCKVYEQLEDGFYSQEPVEEGSERGKEIFAGEIEWNWNPVPETIFRYSARIPGSMIRSNEAPYMVIDYLLIVPDVRKINGNDVDEIMKQAPQMHNLEALIDFLEKYKDKIFYDIVTSWNVEGVKQ